MRNLLKQQQITDTDNMDKDLVLAMVKRESVDGQTDGWTDTTKHIIPPCFYLLKNKIVILKKSPLLRGRKKKRSVGSAHFV